MDSRRQDIQSALDEVRHVTGTDFAGMATYDKNSHLIRWQYVSGNRNNRYRRITLRPGIGIAGKVVVSGRPMVLEAFVPRSGDDSREYPILLAEDLKTVMAAPLVVKDRVRGVLLVGYRTPRPLPEEVRLQVESLAVDVSRWLDEQPPLREKTHG